MVRVDSGGGGMRSVGTVLILVVPATVVATGARRWRIPAPSLLVVAGIVVALVPGTPEIRVSPEAIGLVVLPPLLYAAAEELPWRELRLVWEPVSVLAVGLVLAAVGAVASLLTPLSWQMALVLGVVLASTDPVAVTALGRRLAPPLRGQVLVQAESLFNDATSLVLFRVAVVVATASADLSWQAAGGEFALLAGGGVLNRRSGRGGGDSDPPQDRGPRTGDRHHPGDPIRRVRPGPRRCTRRA